MTESRCLVPSISNSPRLHIEHLPISQLKRNARNPRRHPDKQIGMLARNIDTFGFLLPCLVEEKDRLLSGNARVLAAQRLGITEIPVVRIQHLTEVEKRAFIIADNKLAELADWDAEILRGELQFFADLNIDFDFSAIGFETAEVDIILDTNNGGEEDVLPHIVTGKPPITRPGDLWTAGPHSILCANAQIAASYETLLGDEQARLVVTDPPKSTGFPSCYMPSIRLFARSTLDNDNHAAAFTFETSLFRLSRNAGS
jgi:ParB-like nuclease domain